MLLKIKYDIYPDCAQQIGGKRVILECRNLPTELGVVSEEFPDCPGQPEKKEILTIRDSVNLIISLFRIPNYIETDQKRRNRLDQLNREKIVMLLDIPDPEG